MRLSALAIYLRDHEAAAQAGLSLFRRVARSQDRHPWGREIAGLRDEVRADLKDLRRLMQDQAISADPLLGLTMRAGEVFGRAKPNGRLLRRSPLSDLLEVEALLDAVQAKQRGWEALLAVGIETTEVDLDALRARAKSQRQRLRQIHQDVASRVLTG